MDGELEFAKTTIEGECSFPGEQFPSLVVFDDVEVYGSLWVDHAEFELAVTMAKAAIKGGELSFADSHVHAPEGTYERLESEAVGAGDIHAPESQVEENLTLNDGEIEGDIGFPDSGIEGSMYANDSVIGGSARFESADIGDWRCSTAPTLETKTTPDQLFELARDIDDDSPEPPLPALVNGEFGRLLAALQSDD